MAEVWCDYCSGFQRLETDVDRMVCDNCRCTVGKVTPSGKMWCEDCQSYRKTAEEDPRPAPQDDADNQGYLLGDVSCGQCGAILMSLREPQPVQTST